jgi:hypothetical protein
LTKPETKFITRRTLIVVQYEEKHALRPTLLQLR